MKYLSQFTIILCMTLIGDLLNKLIPLPIPASVYGMLLLFVSLTTGLVKLSQVEAAGDFLLSVLPLTFLPAGASLLLLWKELRALLAPLLLATVFVTPLVMGVTGRVAQRLLRRDSAEPSS